MKSRLSLTSTLLLVTIARTHVGAGEIAVGAHRFTLPDGFTIERVAATPLVERPIVADLDFEGRLYIADSSGSNEKVHDQLETRPHRVVRLEDVDGDGVYDRSTVFADRLPFPEGALFHEGSLYVAAPPSIWRLTDTDGDGVADERLEWFEGKTLTSCANDLHGPYAGLDGRIYWAKGAFAKQIHERPDRKPLVTRAAHIFRARAEGSDVEAVLTGGMDNPVEVAFLPNGERFITTTFFQHPAAGRRDGLIHAIYGGVYGKDHAVLDGHPRTGDLMPILTHLGAAAPCGLVRYRSRAFGELYRDNLFATLFNLRKVTRHELIPDGATYRTVDHDFVVSSNGDFHPTDVLEDADGSLLVLDTGGWYKICCPSSQLARPEVLGAVYRVRRVRRHGASPEDPRGARLDWSGLSAAALVRLLDDERPVVRDRAASGLVGMADAGLPALERVVRTSPSAAHRRGAHWVLGRHDSEGARRLSRLALEDRDGTVRRVGAHVAALWRDRDAAAALARLSIEAAAPGERRVAAEALGRIGQASSVAALLESIERADPVDRTLEHSRIFALIEIAASDATRKGLESASVRVQRACLLALEQMEGSGLAAAEVIAHLTSPEHALRETAAWIASRHPEWAPEISRTLTTRLEQAFRPEIDDDTLSGLLAHFANHPPVQEAIAAALRSTAPRQAHIARRAILEATIKPAPASWAQAVSHHLAAAAHDDELRRWIGAARAVSSKAPGPLRTSLTAIAVNRQVSRGARLEALSALPGELDAVQPGVIALLLESLGTGAARERLRAAELISRARLSSAQQVQLVDVVATLGPLTIGRLAPALGRFSEENRALELIAALEQAPGRGALAGSTFLDWVSKSSPRVRARAAGLLRELAPDRETQLERLETLAEALPGGDAKRGQSIFRDETNACATCHAIGYVGGRLGPDLTNIGRRRSPRDLLESIVFPSASLVRSYETWVVTTRQGEVVTGILRHESDAEIVLAIDAISERRFRREDVVSLSPGATSLMPAGLVDRLTPGQLADLVAFLRGAGW